MAHLVSGRLEQCYISVSTFNVLFFLLFAYFFVHLFQLLSQSTNLFSS